MAFQFGFLPYTIEHIFIPFWVMKSNYSIHATSGEVGPDFSSQAHVASKSIHSQPSPSTTSTAPLFHPIKKYPNRTIPIYQEIPCLTKWIQDLEFPDGRICATDELPLMVTNRMRPKEDSRIKESKLIRDCCSVNIYPFADDSPQELDDFFKVKH